MISCNVCFKKGSLHMYYDDKNQYVYSGYHHPLQPTPRAKETTKIHMEYYLKNIMSDMGYNIIDKKDITKFILKQDKELNEQIKNDILEKFQLGENINVKI